MVRTIHRHYVKNQEGHLMQLWKVREDFLEDVMFELRVKDKQELAP